MKSDFRASMDRKQFCTLLLVASFCTAWGGKRNDPCADFQDNYGCTCEGVYDNSGDMPWGSASINCANSGYIMIPPNFPENTVKLDMSHNKLKRIHDESLDMYPNLRILHLDDNHLEEIEETAFSYVPELLFVSIADNPRINRPPRFFNNPKLRSIVMDGCHFGWVRISLEARPRYPNGTLVEPKDKRKEVNVLDFSTYLPDSVSYVSLANNSVQSFPHDFGPNLRELNLENNNLKIIGDMRSSPVLETVHLQKNRIEVLDFDSSWALPSTIRTLDLGDNPIRHISDGFFQTIGKIEFFNMRNTALQMVPPKSFHGLRLQKPSRDSSTRYIDFNENKYLEVIPHGTLDPFLYGGSRYSQLQVYVMNTAFDCSNCMNSWIPDVTFSKKLVTSPNMVSFSGQCANPPSMRQVHIMDLKRDDFRHCSDENEEPIREPAPPVHEPIKPVNDPTQPIKDSQSTSQFVWDVAKKLAYMLPAVYGVGRDVMGQMGYNQPAPAYNPPPKLPPGQMLPSNYDANDIMNEYNKYYNGQN